MTKVLQSSPVNWVPEDEDELWVWVYVAHQMGRCDNRCIGVAILSDVHPATEVPEVWRGRLAWRETKTNKLSIKEC